MAKAKVQSTPKKRINLALQGGGSFGAFTWGVLDRLLEDERLEIAALSGTSAGAMNAAALCDGLMDGGPEGARATLRQFWEGLADAMAGPTLAAPLQGMFGLWSSPNSPFGYWMEVVARSTSPYDFNPLNWNPLRELLEKLVDFERVRSCNKVGFYVSATNVHTGRVRVFDRSELTADHVMASACLPFLFQAVSIEGVPYWDGGYMGNPALWPLFETSDTDDTVVVQINPLCRQRTPRTAREIMDRVNEITFNASLLREFRAIDFVNRLLEDGRLEGTSYRRVLIHMIDETDRSVFDSSSRIRISREMLGSLFESGRAAAEHWLARSFDDLGKRSTVDLRKLFQGDEDGLDGQKLKPGRAPASRASGSR